MQLRLQLASEEREGKREIRDGKGKAQTRISDGKKCAELSLQAAGQKGMGGTRPVRMGDLSSVA